MGAFTAPSGHATYALVKIRQNQTFISPSYTFLKQHFSYIFSHLRFKWAFLLFHAFLWNVTFLPQTLNLLMSIVLLFESMICENTWKFYINFPYTHTYNNISYHFPKYSSPHSHFLTSDYLIWTSVTLIKVLSKFPTLGDQINARVWNQDIAWEVHYISM